MSGLFAVLFMLTLILGAFSVIRPGKNKKTGKPFRRRDMGIGFSLFAVIFLILFGITAPPQKTPTSKINLSATKTKAAAPKVTTKTVTETKSVPFSSTTVNDSSLAKGTSKITTKGVDGVETLTYKEAFTNGQQTAKQLVSDKVTTQAVTQVTTVGTYVAPAPTSSATTAPSSSAQSSCHPLSSGGNCYEPGEYCSNADHGMSGVAGDGKSITCEDNKGWRWEPN